MSTSDDQFQAAVAAIDAGDVPLLEQLLAEHPRLACERLDEPGSWLRDKVGKALDDFFQRPYLLWFVAEDPVRNGTLPRNIAEVAAALIGAARRECPDELRRQLDHALLLVGWSWIARECEVQIALIDVLIDAGASPDGVPNNALVNGNFAAAAHLVARGAPLTLASALCLGRWDAVPALAAAATSAQKQFALTLSALRGQAEAVRRLLEMGVDVNAVCTHLYSHGTPLHHAVDSGSLETVTVLVEAGAKTTTKDTLYGGTPLGWAEYSNANKPGYVTIVNYLRAR